MQALNELSISLQLTLLITGISGRLSDSYTGTMTRPDREAVALKLWVK